MIIVLREEASEAASVATLRTDDTATIVAMSIAVPTRLVGSASAAVAGRSPFDRNIRVMIREYLFCIAMFDATESGL